MKLILILPYTQLPIHSARTQMPSNRYFTTTHFNFLMADQANSLTVIQYGTE